MGRKHLFVCLESFCKSSRIFFSPLSERVESLDFRHNGTRSPHVTGESQTPNTALNWRCQSGPSSQKFIRPSLGKILQRILVQSNSDCRFRIFILTNSIHQPRLRLFILTKKKKPNPATCACWKVRFKTEVCTCWQFPTEAMLWIKEVELVDAVDDLKSSCSVRGIRMPDLEVLDAKIASALNRIILNFSLLEKGRGRQIAYLIYEYFLVIGANDSVEKYADLFTIGFRNDDIQEIDSKWDGILLWWRKSHLRTSWKDCKN